MADLVTVFVGTRAEAEAMGALLAEAGVSSRIDPAGASDPDAGEAKVLVRPENAQRAIRIADEAGDSERDVRLSETPTPWYLTRAGRIAQWAVIIAGLCLVLVLEGTGGDIGPLL